MAGVQAWNDKMGLLEQQLIKTGAFVAGLQDLAELLDGFSARALTSPDAARLVNQLSAYKDGLPAKVRSLRARFQEGDPSEAEQLDFHTAYELLYRFVDDLHNYALTHASLADHRVSQSASSQATTSAQVARSRVPHSC